MNNRRISQSSNSPSHRYNAKCLDVVSSSERLQELVDMKKDIIGYDPNIVEIANLGKVILTLRICEILGCFHSLNLN